MPRARAKFRSRTVLVLTCVLAAGACGSYQKPQRPPPTVGVVTIETQPAQLTTVLPGRTDSFEVSDVRPQVNGILLKRLFIEGSVVKQGQPLYQIDPAPYQAAFDNAMAALGTAKAKAARYQMLVKADAIAPQDYDDAVAAYREALANVKSARINLGYTKITAPITGLIGRSAFTAGALLTAQQTNALATIQTLDPIYVDITQSTSELLALKAAIQHGRVTDKLEDARVTLMLDNGAAYPLPGKLEFSEVTVDQTTGAITLRALFPNPQGILLPGMFVRATIIEGVEPNAILAPQEAVSRNERGEPIAYVVNAKGNSELRVLKTTRAVGDKWLVAAGLAPGDRLIVQGLQRVIADEPVHLMPVRLSGR